MRVGQFFDYCRELYPAWDVVLASRLADLFALPRERRLSQLSARDARQGGSRRFPGLPGPSFFSSTSP